MSAWNGKWPTEKRPQHSERVPGCQSREEALRIVARRGKHIAVVALARRLAGILYALLRDGTVFAPRPSPLPGAGATLAGAVTV